jgi:hypothetical protein
LITKENDMTTSTKLTASLAIAVSVVAGLALSSATPSLAQDTHYYEPSQNGSVWSYYPGYTASTAAQPHASQVPAHESRAQASATGNRRVTASSHRAGTAFTNRGRTAFDDPPGSVFQDRNSGE